jgi:L-ascorbate metabolism protein UlaG (beta-lactamase superfamily)
MSLKPKITFLGTSGFLIEAGDSKLLIDPVNKKRGDVEGDLVYCTHNHFDHIGGVQTFLERNPEAILVGNKHVLSKFPEFENRSKLVSEGESFEYKSFSLSFTKLDHGVFKSVYNLAVEVRVGDFVFAHCGDAVSFEGFPTSRVDVLALPISGVFAASPKKSREVVQNLEEPRPLIVPMHYMIRSPKSFCRKLKESVPDVTCIVPTPGEPLKGFE